MLDSRIIENCSFDALPVLIGSGETIFAYNPGS